MTKDGTCHTTPHTQFFYACEIKLLIGRIAVYRFFKYSRIKKLLKKRKSGSTSAAVVKKKIKIRIPALTNIAIERL